MNKITANQVFIGMAAFVLLLFLVLPQWAGTLSAMGQSMTESRSGATGLFTGDVGDVRAVCQIFAWLFTVSMLDAIGLAVLHMAEEKLNKLSLYASGAAVVCYFVSVLAWFNSEDLGVAKISSHPAWVGFVIMLLLLGALVAVPMKWDEVKKALFK